MNRVVAQQELERQNFRVRGSGGDAVFRPAARWDSSPDQCLHPVEADV
jgi:hypothetical protein